jgi:hypothetical protein
MLPSLTEQFEYTPRQIQHKTTHQQLEVPRQRDVFLAIYTCEFFQIKILGSDCAVRISDFNFG